MKGLVLAEKPSLMRAIQTAYRGDTFPFDLDFAAFHGHLLELCEPGDYNSDWKSWKLETLPMIPEQFRYRPVDKKSIQAILAQIQQGHYDFLVNGCDAGREGELIFWSFYEANGLKLPVKRLWSSTVEVCDLQKALHSLRPSTDFENLRASSVFRAQFDWLVGMNFSRAVGLRTKSAAHIGRVMTPTLKMVVDREREIREFVPQDFFETVATLKKDSDSFEALALVPPEGKQTRFQTEEEAKRVLAALQPTATVLSVATKKNTTRAPTLYSTAALQKDANKYFKLRATRTDAIAQELYEAGYISYPRTECRFIPTSMVPDIPKMLKPLENFPELQEALRQVTPDVIHRTLSGKTYVDDSKLTDHPAITPTAKTFDPDRLTPEQRRLYLLIAKRFLSIFLPPYVTGGTVVLLDSGGVRLRATGRVVLQKGFSILYQDRSRDTPLPELQKGDTVDVTGKKIRSGKTTPPERYTEETLIAAMENAGRFVTAAHQREILRDACGLGTGATRAGILAKLETANLCTVEKNHYVPTPYGMALTDAVATRDVASPAMTATWEERLQDLEKNGNPEAFRTAMLDYVRRETADLIGSIDTNLSSEEKEVIGKCPLCGQDVLVTPMFYRCSAYRAKTDPCTLIVRRKDCCGTTVSKKDMKALLAGRKTGQKTLKSRAGKKYRASLVLNAEGRAVPDFAAKGNAAGAQEGICPCPLCGEGRIYRSTNYYLCTRRKDGCQFLVNPGLCSGNLTDQNVIDLAAGRATAPISFTWKNGKTGMARLQGAVAEKDGKRVLDLKFLFDDRPRSVPPAGTEKPDSGAPSRNRPAETDVAG